MGRLEQEIKQIDQLNNEDGYGISKKIIVAAVLIGVNVFSMMRNPDPDAINIDKLEGPLASFRVKPANETIVACRMDVCTVDITAPVLYPDQIPLSPEQAQAQAQTQTQTQTSENGPSVSAAETVALSKAQDNPAQSDKTAFNFSIQQTRKHAQLLQVPVTAVVLQGTDSVVWLALDDLAVPVRVAELGRTDSKVIITEASAGLIRGLPVSLENWSALGGNERSHIWQAARNLGQAGMNKLLRPDSRIITAPDLQLRVGSRIRSKNHG